MAFDIVIVMQGPCEDEDELQAMLNDIRQPENEDGSRVRCVLRCDTGEKVYERK